MNRTDVTIDAAALHPISPDLWGIFLEDLNFALDGGLNADLIANGDFEFTQADGPQWGPLTRWSVESPVRTRTVWPREEEPLHPANAIYVRVEGPTVLRNDGWDGMSMVAGRKYRVRLAARRVSGSGGVTAVVASRAGELTSSAGIDIADGHWSWYETDLDATDTSIGELELRIPDGTVIDIDAVSLRPLDVNGQPELFRADLLQALRDLKPSFVRFPGGCLAHGVGLDNIYDWKGSIGPREQRRQLPNPWGYHQSRAIGYYEFFLLCEMLGASAVPVVAAGVCCQNTPGGPRAVPADAMPTYIQDVLDLVEFARGDASTRWGAVRAELGHEDPFDLRYLGVGNEDEITPDFRDRYAQIEDALRLAHPDLLVIGTSGPAAAGRDFDLAWEYARERNTAMLDEHYYDSPLWFHQNLARYDSYDRSGPRVYLGEYAARSSTLRSALAEAAYMIGLERNSDVVRLASYAPLLARIGHTQWQPDLIYFDSDRVFLSASYHVQRMFSIERGEMAHAVSADFGPGVAVQVLQQGEIVLNASEGAFALSAVEVNGAQVPDFEFDAITPGSVGYTNLSDLDLRFVARRLSGQVGFRLDLGGDGEGARFAVGLGDWKNERVAVHRHQHGISGDVADLEFWRGFATGIDTRIRIEVRNGRFRLWADDVLIQDVTPSVTPEQRIAVGAASRQGVNGPEHVLRLVNATSEPAPLALRIAGHAIDKAKLETLAGTDPDAGAAFESSPARTATETISAIDGALEVELPPWSFAVAVVTSKATA